MKKKVIIVIAVFVGLISIGSYLYSNQTNSFSISDSKNFETLSSEYFTRDSGNWISIPSTSIFQTYVKENDVQLEENREVYGRIILELDPSENYDEIESDGKTVVVYPTFTSSAYSEPGFYTYYRGECGVDCLTIQIKNNFAQPQANPNALQVFQLLNYKIITDVDIDKDPLILEKYEKIILLHNEYVTKSEFDAIVNHPNVIYLYPNALYAQVESDYDDNTITLIRGHNYPETQIRNGFDWEFDNSPLEYDRTCNEIQFYRIDNGWMLNCWPENIIHKSHNFLKTIKDL